MRRRFSFGVKVLLTALIFAAFVWQADFHAIFAALSTISPFAVIAATCVVFVQTLIAGQRLAMVVVRFGAKFRLRDSFRITLEGQFFSQTFVSFLGGDALRIWRVRQLGLSTTDATSAVLLDRLTGILVNHAFLLVSLPWLLTLISDRSVKATLVLLAISGIAGFALILLLGSLRGRGGFLHRLRSRIPIRSVTMLIVEASTVGRHFLKQYRHMARVLLLNIFISGANTIVFAIILLGMGVNPSLALSCALLVPAVMEVAMLPISIAGWGVREGAAVVAFGALGLPAHQALGSSVAYGLTVAAVSLVGGVLWLGDRRKWQNLQVSSDDKGARTPSPTRL